MNQCNAMQNNPPDPVADTNAVLRAIAFYLPQYHPVPENDAWWGTGFTEWRNVAKAKPLFPGHYQPHQPADLGFYDLRVPEVRAAQADLARAHGIHGFCYYHYWFNGRRILERPFNEVLASGEPDFPFCLCWANENWSRAWNGGETDVLLAQHYSAADDLAHIQSLFPALSDARYIRIDGKPLLAVYRTQLMPDPARTADIWREAMLRAGLGDLYLARVESFADDLDPASIGFDADIEFAPNWRRLGHPLHRDTLSLWRMKVGLLPQAYLKQTVVKYDSMVKGMLSRPKPAHVRFRGASPGFDNSARRAEGAAILLDATPQRYAEWLQQIVQDTLSDRQGDERIVFINAWNEWAEGNHLEPDLRHGDAFLRATAHALGTPLPIR